MKQLTRTLLALSLISLVCALTSSAQPIPSFTTICDTTVATTAWDSTWVGAPGFVKYVSVTNLSATIILKVALENDTTAPNILYLRPQASYSYPAGLSRDRRFIRTKSASSTANRYIISTY